MEACAAFEVACGTQQGEGALLELGCTCGLYGPGGRGLAVLLCGRAAARAYLGDSFPQFGPEHVAWLEQGFARHSGCTTEGPSSHVVPRRLLHQSQGGTAGWWLPAE